MGAQESNDAFEFVRKKIDTWNANGWPPMAYMLAVVLEFTSTRENFKFV